MSPFEDPGESIAHREKMGQVRARYKERQIVVEVRVEFWEWYWFEEIFKINARRIPVMWNLHDSIGLKDSAMKWCKLALR